MNCRKVNHFLSAYIDGELPGVEHRQIHEHLSRCSECAEEYQALLHMKRLLAGMRVRQPQNDLSQHILSQIHQSETPRPTLPTWLDLALDWLRTPIPAPYLAIGATMAIVGALSLSRAINSHDPIQWKPSTPSQLQDVGLVETIDPRTPNLYSHTLPIINVGLHQTSMPAPRYYTDFMQPQAYVSHSSDPFFFTPPHR